MLDPSTQYRSIIRLTETRDIHHVNSVFLETLESLVVGRFALYVVDSVGRETRFLLCSSENPFGADVDSVLALFDPGSNVTPKLVKGLRPFPLASVNGLHALLILDRKAQVVDEVFLNFLISIYCNQFNLVETCSCDALTGLMNRSEFDKKLSLFPVSDGRQRSTDVYEACLAILDVDHFKNINDTYGHLYGDEVLLLLGQQMAKIFREEDWLFRYGGEEFAIILRDVTAEQSDAILERAREHIESFCFPQIEKVTVSIGYTLLDAFETNSGLIAQADAALYYAKENGRNQIQSYQALLAKGALSKRSMVVGDIDLF